MLACVTSTSSYTSRFQDLNRVSGAKPNLNDFRRTKLTFETLRYKSPLFKFVNKGIYMTIVHNLVY